MQLGLVTESKVLLKVALSEATFKNLDKPWVAHLYLYLKHILQLGLYSSAGRAPEL